MKTEKIINYGTCGLVCFHMVVCGLPLLATVAGIASPFAGIISPIAMKILLGIAGMSLIVSWIFYFSGCKCNKKLLIFSTILFTLAVSAHFIIPQITEVESCH